MDKHYLHSNTPFALYRLPNSEEVKLILQRDNSFLKRIPISDISIRNGFVISEFLSGGFCYFIQGNKYSIKSLNDIVLNIEYQELKKYNKIDKEEYLNKANCYINSFDDNLKKAILSRTKEADVSPDFSLLNAFDNLCNKHPNAFVYIHHSKEFGFWVGATPEILMQQQGDTFTTMSLAGTQPFSENIIWTDKEREEQQLVTDYIEQTLASQNISFSKSATDTVKAGSVAHLRTLFALKQVFNLGTLVSHLHPTPAVCGLPKDKALDLINTIEHYNRSLYTGFIGEIGENTQLFVNLRCMQLFKDKALIYVGGGLTKYSQPDKEWAETELKAQTMVEVLKNNDDLYPVISNNPIVKALVEIMAAKGVKHVVFSPGSRNAPIAVSIFNDERFTARVIADERSAGFVALGMALELQQPVAVCCTSGTALLNYAPAVAEAHYQNIPLIVLSADRPEEFIDQGEGQSMRQKNVFANYINKSIHLPRAITDNDVLWHTERSINEAIDSCYTPKVGPVHINIPFAEPLYNFEKTRNNYTPKLINRTQTHANIANVEQQRLENIWKTSTKKLIVCGQMPNNKRLNHLLDTFSNDSSVVVLAENISNLYSKRFVACTDRVIASINNSNSQNFSPDLLITMGDAVVSKRIKSLLRNVKPKQHWDVNPNHLHYDTYQSLTESIAIQPETFCEHFAQLPNDAPSDYANKWLTLNYVNQEKHETFIQSAPYSDLKVFANVLDFIPEGVALHLSNSSVIRYVQLFDTLKDVTYYSNRGVSGIEGSTSTALGCSLVNNKVNVLITGDISFLYDSNGLWNKYLHPKFKIIMINNSGGGIFRYIPGPSDTNILEEFFEAKQNYSAREICHTFGLEYLSANDESSLERQLEILLTNFERPMLLEVKTPSELNPKILKDYFNNLK